MNKQTNYIIHGFFLCMLFLAALFIFNKISLLKFTNDHNNLVIVDRKDSEKLTESQSNLSFKGKALFQSKCASCHNIFKDMTGPALINFEERGPWKDRKKVYKWVRNPAAFMNTDSYTKELKTKFGSIMLAFPDIADQEIDAIIEYINSTQSDKVIAER